VTKAGHGAARAEGTLVVVATPIGNLHDLAPRAREEISGADVIACEDTRVLRRLLSHLGLPTPETVIVERNRELSAAATVLRHLKQGRKVALMTDAGTPGISDPGARVVAAAADAGIRVTVVPGPSALVAALAISGFCADRFCFEGFLPRTGKERKLRLERLASEERTIVLYEAPHRISRTLADLAHYLGESRRAVVAREMTKRYEQLVRGTLGELAQGVSPPRGEYVLVVQGADSSQESADEIAEDRILRALREEVAKGASRRDAAARVAEQLGIARRDAYALSSKLASLSSKSCQVERSAPDAPTDT
jgi:16S rRNA (cytidine1402-2'-O)-methyltransferase